MCIRDSYISSLSLSHCYFYYDSSTPFCSSYLRSLAERNVHNNSMTPSITMLTLMQCFRLLVIPVYVITGQLWSNQLKTPGSLMYINMLVLFIGYYNQQRCSKFFLRIFWLLPYLMDKFRRIESPLKRANRKATLFFFGRQMARRWLLMSSLEFTFWALLSYRKIWENRKA